MSGEMTSSKDEKNAFPYEEKTAGFYTPKRSGSCFFVERESQCLGEGRPKGKKEKKYPTIKRGTLNRRKESMRVFCSGVLPLIKLFFGKENRFSSKKGTSSGREVEKNGVREGHRANHTENVSAENAV